MSNFEPGASPYAEPQHVPVSEDRSTFITRTYNYLFASILAFVFLEFLFFKMGIAESFAKFASNTSWLLILGGFVLLSWGASYVAWRVKSVGLQFLMLVSFIVFEALLFTVPLYVAQTYFPDVIGKAAMITLAGFASLTAVVFITKKDFSFLRSFLIWGGMLAMTGIVASLLLGFTLGTWFSVGMILLAGASILYDTSKLVKGFPADRPIAAALELFASIMLMFWYVLRLLMSRN